MQDIEKRVEWANGDLASTQATADQSIRTNFATRKERILNDREVEEALGARGTTDGEGDQCRRRGLPTDPGRRGRSAGVVPVGDGHAILILTFSDQETEERISIDIGGPGMSEHLLLLLSGPPERSSGAVVAGAA